MLQITLADNWNKTRITEQFLQFYILPNFNPISELLSSPKIDVNCLTLFIV